MTKGLRWAIAMLGGLMLVLVVAALLVHRWLGTDDFRQRVQREASTALGVPVAIGALSVTLLPLPALAVDAVAVRTQPALTVGRIELRPSLSSLWRGRLLLDTLVLRDATVPALALDAMARAAQKKKAAAASQSVPEPAALPLALPRQVQVDALTWVDMQGRATTLDAQARLDADGWPQALDLKVLKGRYAGATLDLTPDAVPGRWQLLARLAGGTVRGPMRLVAEPGGWLLSGELATRGVRLGDLLAARPGATPPLAGTLEANTTLRGRAARPSAMADALQTESRFTVSGAVVNGIDLATAVQTVGLSRGGETRLDTLAGQVLTRGRTVEMRNLVASSGVLSANGNVTIAAGGTLGGRVTVVLAASATRGAVGVPLVVGGTLDAPSVMLTRGALLGAAIGTAIAPGVGTGAGATLGDRLGQGLKGLFGK